MSDRTTSNKAVFRRLHDAMNTGDVELVLKMIDDVVAPNLLFHAPVPVGANGVEALKQVMAILLRVYPDLHLVVEDLIAEGDKVVGRTTVTGTHRGEYMGIKPTGKPVTYNEIFIFRFVNGHVTEIWGVVDVLAQLQQLGVGLPVTLAPSRTGA
jgi:predicted ester cyclase